MSEPMEHIERLAPPWRSDRFTECGHKVEEFASVLSRAEAIAKFKRLGKQRAALSTCMTCCSRVNYSQGDSWEDDPTAGVQSDLASFAKRRDILADELRVLAILYERHPEEYEAIKQGLADAVDISQARRERRTR